MIGLVHYAAMSDTVSTSALAEAMRNVLLSRRRALLLELTELERSLCVGRFATHQAGPLGGEGKDFSPIDVARAGETRGGEK